MEDHPRSRGVYATGSRSARRKRGSSPLARGLPAREEGPGERGRIIPARAGFTGSQSRAAARRPDHPRSRGVYPTPGLPARGTSGSSPLARGLRAVLRSRGPDRRIIPARAGFTHGPPLGAGLVVDHPRSRGVYAVHDVLARYYRGSSPLARGLLRAADGRRRWVGIIPARAGFTETAPRRRRHPADHPRSRGVYSPACRCTR